MKRTTFSFVVLCGLVLLTVAALIPPARPGAVTIPAALSQPVQAADVGFAVLPDGRGGTNVESVLYTEAMGGGIPEDSLPDGTVAGTAGVGRGTYFGPGAPAGPRYHRYVFELYALSAMLNLPPEATRAQLLDAMKTSSSARRRTSVGSVNSRRRRHTQLCLLLLLVCLGQAGRLSAFPRPAQSVAPPAGTAAEFVSVIQDYTDGLVGVRARNPDVHLRVGRDATAPDERVLFVDYPGRTADPAGRDVQCDAGPRARGQDWTRGRAIAFHVKPAQSVRLSLSFFDRNRVAYTAWIDVKGGVWQLVRVPFNEIRPNPYFQLPEAKAGSAIDVSAVTGIAFAPQDQAAGQLAIGRFFVSN